LPQNSTPPKTHRRTIDIVLANVKQKTGKCVFNLHTPPTLLIYLQSQNHKPACTNNAEHAAQLAQADQSGILAHSLPQGITLTDLDQRLEKWIKFHNSTLMAATIHALALPRDIKRSRTHIVRMQVSYREDNNGAPGKFFRVDGAEAIEMDEARRLGGAWPESLVQIGKLREESEKRRMGTVAAIGVECYPLAVQIVPFGSLRDLSPLEIVKDWEQVLKRDVQNAKKFTRFGP
jgi:splicing suppressor protein 51